MANALSGSKILPLLKSYGTTLKGAIVNGSVGIPRLKTGGVVYQGAYGQISAVLPAVDIVAEGGALVSLTAPVIKLSAGAKADTIGAVVGRLPAVTVTASGLAEGQARIVGILPALRISSGGHLSALGIMTASLPSVRLTSSAINGLLGEVITSIPSVKLTSAAYWLSGASLSGKLPSLRIHSRAENSNILAILINTKNFALTEYSKYNYNSLGIFNDKMVGAKTDGIYELSGDDDDGESIEWSFKTGKLDMDDNGLKRARHAWVSYNPSGDLLLVVDDGENQYEYGIESVKQIDNAIRVKLGKGIRNRFLQFEIKNIANEKINLDRLRIFAESTSKKR